MDKKTLIEKLNAELGYGWTDFAVAEFATWLTQKGWGIEENPDDDGLLIYHTMTAVEWAAAIDTFNELKNAQILPYLEEWEGKKLPYHLRKMQVALNGVDEWTALKFDDYLTRLGWTLGENEEGNLYAEQHMSNEELMDAFDAYMTQTA